MTESIKTGDRIEITMKNENDEKVYVSQVEQIVDKNNMVIQAPIYYGRIVTLDKTKLYSILVISEKGMFRYDVEVMDYVKKDGLVFTNILLLSEGEKMQRREYWRLNCLLPLKFTKVESDYSSDGQMTDGITKDISAGGIRFITNGILNVGDTIKCVILLNTEYFLTVGRIIDKRTFPKSNFKYQYRVRFFGMQKTEQEKIFQFIFNEQRKLLQKTNAKER